MNIVVKKSTLIAHVVLLAPTICRAFTSMPMQRLKTSTIRGIPDIGISSASAGIAAAPTKSLLQHQQQQQHLPFYASNIDGDFGFSKDENDSNIMEPIFTKRKTQLQTQRSTKNHGVHPILKKSWKSIRSTIALERRNQLQRKIMTLVTAALVMASVIFAPFNEAMAAPSGGRMGGSFGGSSRSSSSRSAPSRSYSNGGNYNRGFNRGYSNGYSSRPSVIVAPGVGVGSYNYGYYPRPGVAIVQRGPSIVDVIVFGAFAAIILSTFSRPRFDDDDDSGGFLSTASTSALGPGVTVAQISVALNVPRRNDPSSILSFLDRLSNTASTDSRVGISDLINQVSVELLRQKRSIFAADTEFKHFRNGGSERHFSSKAIQERSKFEKESTNKFGGVDYAVNKKSGSDKLLQADDGFSPQATSAVVTLVIAIDGDSTKLPQINSISDLEKALTRLATDVKVDDCLRSAEILWTPDDKNDVLSEREVVADYPKLRSV